MTERRNSTGKIEVRSADGERGGGVLVGYAAVFYDPEDRGTEYNLSDFSERIAPGAFDAALERGDDVRALFNHDSGIILGRSVANTLRLSVDERGLKYEIDLPDTTAAADVRTLIERGDVSGSSFAFHVDSQSWREEDDKIIRNVESVSLFDVGPVTYPAYQGTEVDARSLEQFKASRNNEADEARAALTTARAKYFQRIARARSLEVNA